MNSITITGLTRRQVQLLDTMWMMQSQEEVEAWQSTLSAKDHVDSLGLQIMLMQELMEELILDDPESQDQVKHLLAKYQL